MVVIADLKNSLSGVVEMETWMKSVKERYRGEKVEVAIVDSSSIFWNVLCAIPIWGLSHTVSSACYLFPLYHTTGSC